MRRFGSDLLFCMAIISCLEGFSQASGGYYGPGQSARTLFPQQPDIRDNGAENPFLVTDPTTATERSYQSSKMSIPVDDFLFGETPILGSTTTKDGMSDSNRRLPDLLLSSSVSARALQDPSQLRHAWKDNLLSQSPSPQQEQARNAPLPRVRHTGTTIAGLVVGPEYCLLAADTRATMDSTVADTRAEKLHPLVASSLIWAAGAGTSADLQHVARSCRYQFHYQTLVYDSTIGNQPHDSLPPNHNLYHAHPNLTSVYRIRPANGTNHHATTTTRLSMASVCHWLRNHLYQQAGNCQANLIVGGICPQTWTPLLRVLHPHGSMDTPTVPFAALGSGGMAAMAILEQGLLRHRGSNNKNNETDLTLEEGLDLLIRAVRAGIENDLGSGSQIDLVLVRVQRIKDDDHHQDTTVRITTEYRRAAVPEPPFSPTSSESSGTGGGTYVASLSSQDTGGVNGFGNAPLVVRPVRSNPPPPPTTTGTEEEWNARLGLPQR